MELSKERIRKYGEVFTPEKQVKEMVDLVFYSGISGYGSNFLDPACGSGNFLSEILKRIYKSYYKFSELDSLNLLSGLHGIDILQDNVNSCRENLLNEWSNIVSRSLGRDISQETLNKAKKLLEEQIICCDFLKCNIHKNEFNVIISNPPYQMEDGGYGRSAIALYPLFFMQSLEINPDIICMITPSRWFTCGRNLDSFRKYMLSCRHISNMVDYRDSRDVFPDVNISGGVNYFLWNKKYLGRIVLLSRFNNKESYSYVDSNNEYGIMFRDFKTLCALKNIYTPGDESIFSYSKEFHSFPIKSNAVTNGTIPLKSGRSYKTCSIYDLGKQVKFLNKWKVIISRYSNEYAGYPDKEGKRTVTTTTEVLPPGTVCNDIYSIYGIFDNEEHAKNMKSYLETKFCKFLVSILSINIHIPKKDFRFVPVVDFSRSWSDNELYEKFHLSPVDISHIESLIKDKKPES